MSEDVEILIANIEDAEDIAQIARDVGKMHEEALPEYFLPRELAYDLDMIRKMIEGELSEVFKAVVGGKICGFLTLSVFNRPANLFVYSKYGCIGDIGVDEFYRDRGIGTLLIQTAEDWCRSKGIKAMELGVFAFNENAKRLYEKLEYKELTTYRFKFL
ncbi:MAG: GNAT family N-acetyltransferase [Alphaproteobacteria bacterium]|nr:GNAT family N-acetyltransferase [Alphaproteobacteria bacterium]